MRGMAGQGECGCENKVGAVRMVCAESGSKESRKPKRKSQGGKTDGGQIGSIVGCLAANTCTSFSKMES